MQNIRQNSDEGIFNFRISGQYVIKKCHNSRPVMTLTWNLSLRLVTKLDKTSKTRSKDYDDVMSEICDVIAIFPIYDQFGAIRKMDSGHIVCKTYIFIKSNVLSCKNWKHNKKIFNASLTLLLWVKVLFWPKKTLTFCKKYWHQQNQENLGTKRYTFWK